MEPTDGRAEADGTGKRAGIAALVGRANVGKSSLLNALIGEKVSIVTPVAQTTRIPVRAVRTEPRGQVVFLDTPGVHAAAADLGRLMNRAARAAVEGVDVAVLVLDGSSPPREEDVGWMKRLARPGSPPCLVALNKCDLGLAGETRHRAAWTRTFGEERAPLAWLPCSAVTGQGIAALADRLFEHLPVHPPLFPEDVLSDFPRKLAIADTIREKLFLRLRDELPHRVAVEVEDVTEDTGTLRVAATVFVERASQQGIVVGHKGRMLRAIRRASEAELGRLHERPVSVAIRVRTEPNWTRNYWFLKRLGYAP